MTERTDIELRRDVAAMSNEEIDRTYRIAKALALSKRFPDARTADEAFAKILVGRDLGLSPTQALTGLHIVEGKPQIAAVTLAGFVRKSDRYDYAVKEMTDSTCTITFWSMETEVELGDSTFTIEEAKRAGLVKERSNWVKWPKNMLFARAMSNGVKWFCPDLMGGVPIYTEADTFEGTATEVTAGDGDGQPVGWQGIGLDQVSRLENVLQYAEERGHAGLADRATVETIVNGQSREFVSRWIDSVMLELSTMKVPAQRAQESADVLLDLAETPLDDTGALTEQERRRLEGRRAQVLDAIASREEDPGDEGEKDAELRDELDAIERLLCPEHIPGQETLDALLRPEQIPGQETLDAELDAQAAEESGDDAS